MSTSSVFLAHNLLFDFSGTPMWMFLQNRSSVLFHVHTNDVNGDVCVLWAIRLYRLTEKQSKYLQGSLAVVLGCSFISDSLTKNDFVGYSRKLLLEVLLFR